MARLLCGPDRSPWISQSFDTPQRAAQTLFEAIRRDDPDVVYLCLSTAYRRRLGLDGLTLPVFWARFRDQNPGLHVAGYATVPPPALVGTDRATVAVEVEGHVVDVDLERQASWEIGYRLDGVPLAQGSIIPSFAAVARIEPIAAGADEGSRLVLAPLPFAHDDAPVPIESIEHVAITHRWKIADLRVRP